MSFSRSVLCVVLLLSASLAHAQEHIKCVTGHKPFDPKSPKSLYALPSGFRDSLVSQSGKFIIYYSEDVAEGTTPIEFVRQAAMECDSAYEFEITELGYTPPVPTVDNHYYFYLSPLHRTPERPYGATWWLDNGNLPSPSSGTERTRSFCEIENSFPDSVYATTGYDALRITIFHEFFHMVQFSGYGMPPSAPDYIFFQEMSSTWMELHSTPYVKDYFQYAKHYLKNLELRFDEIPGLGKYGQYLFLAYLSNQFGDSIVRRIWEYYRDETDDPMVAIELALADHNTTWCAEYERFGSELLSTRSRDIPDAGRLPIEDINVHHVLNGPSQTFPTFAFSLTIAETIGNSTCQVLLARDTDRSLQSDATISASSSGSALVTLQNPQAFCDTIACSSTLAVLPNPFLLSQENSDSALIYASSRFERPIKTTLDIYSLKGTHVRETDASAATIRTDETWYAPWDGRDDNGKIVESGEYIYKIKVDGALKIGKIVVVRK